MRLFLLNLLTIRLAPHYKLVHFRTLQSTSQGNTAFPCHAIAAALSDPPTILDF